MWRAASGLAPRPLRRHSADPPLTAAAVRSSVLPFRPSSPFLCCQMSLSMRAWLLCGLLAVVATAAVSGQEQGEQWTVVAAVGRCWTRTVTRRCLSLTATAACECAVLLCARYHCPSGASLSAAASASASRTLGLGVLLDVGQGADLQLQSDEFDGEPSLLQLQQEEAEASPEALHRLHGDAVAEQMEAAAAETGAADFALLEAAAQVDAQAETEAEAGSSKFEVFYFSPGPMLYDSGGGTTWKGQSRRHCFRSGPAIDRSRASCGSRCSFVSLVVSLPLPPLSSFPRLPVPRAERRQGRVRGHRRASGNLGRADRGTRRRCRVVRVRRNRR